MEKRCRSCQRSLPGEDFQRCGANPDGLDSECRRCSRLGDIPLPADLKRIVRGKTRLCARCGLAGCGCRRAFREFLLRAITGPCAYCGKPAESIDHRVPTSRGGPHVESNLVGACMQCNRSKRAHTPEEWVDTKFRRPKRELPLPSEVYTRRLQEIGERLCLTHKC